MFIKCKSLFYTACISFSQIEKLYSARNNLLLYTPTNLFSWINIALIPRSEASVKSLNGLLGFGCVNKMFSLISSSKSFNFSVSCAAHVESLSFLVLSVNLHVFVLRCGMYGLNQ